MPDYLLIAVLVLLAGDTALLLWLLRSRPRPTDGLLPAVEKAQERTERSVREEFARSREESAAGARGEREEIRNVLEQVRQTVEARLQSLQADNEHKLEQMRLTVDEKLQGTLEKRLGESFKTVSESLDRVQKGLGEMQSLAAGVGDLKKVLANVKTRGGWGEIQLGNLLEQMLAPDQYGANVAPNPSSGERVEFAVRLPGRDSEPIWLPIDAKFPQEDYQRLQEAQERGDAASAEEACRAIESRIRLEARKIHEKYVSPPHTTDFAIMFLPVEGLFAEVLRRPGLFDSLQRDFRVAVMGPTTLGALLTSLQMGFRTLAIEKRSSEVWTVLGAVKTEFRKFGEALQKVHDKIEDAGRALDDEVMKRKRAMERSLKAVQELPAPEAAKLLKAEPSVEEDGQPQA